MRVGCASIDVIGNLRAAESVSGEAVMVLSDVTRADASGGSLMMAVTLMDAASTSSSIREASIAAPARRSEAASASL